MGERLGGVCAMVHKLLPGRSPSANAYAVGVASRPAQFCAIPSCVVHLLHLCVVRILPASSRRRCAVEHKIVRSLRTRRCVVQPVIRGASHLLSNRPSWSWRYIFLVRRLTRSPVAGRLVGWLGGLGRALRAVAHCVAGPPRGTSAQGWHPRAVGQSPDIVVAGGAAVARAGLMCDCLWGVGVLCGGVVSAVDLGPRAC